jgi:hypothetical protein
MKPEHFARDNKGQDPLKPAQPDATGTLVRHRMDIPLSGDEIAKTAYQGYLSRGSLPGHDVEDWLEAEAILRTERNLVWVAEGGFTNRK